jgi:hypothetical protein
MAEELLPHLGPAKDKLGVRESFAKAVSYEEWLFQDQRLLINM